MLDLLLSAKRSYATRNVDLGLATKLITSAPKAGDLLLCRVDKLRQHQRLENTQGRRVHLYEGDMIITVAAQRYATDQFYSQLPSFENDGACHLVAAGGITGQVVHRSRQVKPPTEITLIGVVADQRETPLNLNQFAPLLDHGNPTLNLPVLVVIGSDMNAGKTTTACAAINGLSIHKHSIAGAKLTGTGAGPDYWRMWDAGAVAVHDFVDAGYASTVGLSNHDFLAILRHLKHTSVEAGAKLLVLEVADGVLQPETKALLSSPEFRHSVTGVLVAADSATSAVMVTERITHAGFPVYAMSGVFSQSPIACEEAAQSTGLPVLTLEDFSKTSTINYLVNSLNMDFDRAHSAAR